MPNIIMNSRLLGDGNHRPYTSFSHSNNALDGKLGAIWKVGMPENSALVHRAFSPVAS